MSAWGDCLKGGDCAVADGMSNWKGDGARSTS